MHADGRYGELLTLPNADRVNPENPIHLTMAGNEVFKVAVTELAHIVDETLAANNLDRSATDWLVPPGKLAHYQRDGEKAGHVDG